MPTLFPELWCEREIRDEYHVVLDFWSQSRNFCLCHWSPSLITPRKISLCHLSLSASCDLSCSLPGFKQKKMVTNCKDPTLKFFEPMNCENLFWRKNKYFNCTETNNSIWSMVPKIAIQSYKWWDKGNGSPLQYSCLENPMDRGAWWATVHGVVKSQTRLNN